MSEYNQQVERSDIAGVEPEDVSSEIIQAATQASAALSLFPSIRMSQKTRRLPVLSVLPTAYWIDGTNDPSSDTGQKKTTQMSWDKKYITAEELAVIVPVPEAVLDDSTFDIFGEVRPRLAEAMARKIDGAVFSGLDAPASWGGNGFLGLGNSADAAGNVSVLGTAAKHEGGVAEDLNELFAAVEADGFDVSLVAAERTFRAVLRSARDTLGQRLGDVSPDGAHVMGTPVSFVIPHTLDDSGDGFVALAGDRTQGILGIRQDISYKLLTEAVIQEANGDIAYNLAQQDMVALRVTFRCGFQVANPVTLSNEGSPTDPHTTRYPFAVLKSHA
jgi:HK97 family phage major capsid protein